MKGNTDGGAAAGDGSRKGRKGAKGEGVRPRGDGARVYTDGVRPRTLHNVYSLC